MTVLNLAVVARFVRKHRDAEAWLRAWVETASRASWQSLRDVRAIYPHADGVPLKGGRVVTVFNVSGNKYRLLTLISYRAQVIDVIDLLTHAEYSREKWKDRQ
jgi:mRNA interferase HigB